MVSNSKKKNCHFLDPGALFEHSIASSFPLGRLEGKKNIFNAFNINNTIANQWITDVNSSYIYPFPVRLTGRFFNVRLNFKF